MCFSWKFSPLLELSALTGTHVNLFIYFFIFAMWCMVVSLDLTPLFSASYHTLFHLWPAYSLCNFHGSWLAIDWPSNDCIHAVSGLCFERLSSSHWTLCCHWRLGNTSVCMLKILKNVATQTNQRQCVKIYRIMGTFWCRLLFGNFGVDSRHSHAESVVHIHIHLWSSLRTEFMVILKRFWGQALKFGLCLK